MNDATKVQIGELQLDEMYNSSAYSELMKMIIENAPTVECDERIIVEQDGWNVKFVVQVAFEVNDDN